MRQPEPVVGRARETAVSLVVAEAEGPTIDFRGRFLTRTIARRIPAHVTILYPFLAADAVTESVVDELRALYSSVASFSFELARIETFDAHVWLAPEPRDRFVELIGLTCARFPECAPYGGVFAESEPAPHLTIGEGVDVEALRKEAERTLAAALPIRCGADSVTLLEEQADGTWSLRATFPLEGR